METKMPPANLLIAYPYFKKDLVVEMSCFPKDRRRLIVDSGAFTAWNTGKTISLDDYCRFLDSIDFLRPFHALQLDVFGDAKKTYENWRVMKARGYDVMPVFTRGDSLERLEEYYAETDYIMFGGIVIGGANANYVKWFLDQNKGRKCHWLGFVNMPFIKAYKPESVDSSSWISGEVYGRIDFYTRSGIMKGFNRKEVFESGDKFVEMARLAARLGLNGQEISLLRDEKSWHSITAHVPDLTKPGKGISAFCCALSYLVRGMAIEHHLGTKVYLAISTWNKLKLILETYNWIEERKVKAWMI